MCIYIYIYIYISVYEPACLSNWHRVASGFAEGALQPRQDAEQLLSPILGVRRAKQV